MPGQRKPEAEKTPEILFAAPPSAIKCADANTIHEQKLLAQPCRFMEPGSVSGEVAKEP